MDTKSLTPEESFDIINKAISNFKINYKESAKIFLLWGWMLSVASFSNFIILKVLGSREAFELMGPYSLTNWGVFALVGFIIQYFMRRNERKEKKVYSHLDNYFNKLWQVTAASFFIATVVCIVLY